MGTSKLQKKTTGLNRENFTTSINSELLYEFRVYCVTNKLKQNEVIEKFIKDLTQKGSEEVGNSN